MEATSPQRRGRWGQKDSAGRWEAQVEGGSCHRWGFTRETPRFGPAEVTPTWRQRRPEARAAEGPGARELSLRPLLPSGVREALPSPPSTRGRLPFLWHLCPSEHTGQVLLGELKRSPQMRSGELLFTFHR